jgi:glutathionylspermidine amidase/synthetase
MTSYRNGSTTSPLKGSLLIWEPRGFFKHTGHVAVIIDVSDTHVDIVEQNVEDTVWPEGINYSRRLPVTRDADGHFHIGCTYNDTRLLGWTIIDYDRTVSHWPQVMPSTSEVQQYRSPRH